MVSAPSAATGPMTSEPPKHLDEAWYARRKRLHSVFASPETTSDASYLENVGRRQRTWSETEVRDLWLKAAARPHREHDLNHVYVHVPFCKSICHFCNYRRLRPTTPELLRTWLDRLKGSLATLEPGISQHKFATVYLGGGTPTVLPPPMISELMEALDRYVPFHPNSKRTVEADPAVVNQAKLETLRAHGFSHVSYGVQSLRRDINLAHDRGPQDPELITRRITEMRQVGIPTWSLDFLFGLAGTTPDEMMRDLDTALRRWSPEWLDVYLITPTPRYLDLHFGGDEARFWAHHATFERTAHRELPQLARRYGYHLEGSQEHYFSLSRQQPMWSKLRKSWAQGALNRLDTWTRDTPLHQPLSGVLRRGGLLGGGASEFTYTQVMHRQHRPLSLLGLGYSARSRVFGEAFFEYQDPGDDPTLPGPATYRGRESTLADEARTYLLYTLRDNNDIDRAHFRRVFGADFREIIPSALPVWVHEGKARETATHIHLLPESRADRTRTLMWMFDDLALEYEICLFRNVDLSADAVRDLLDPLSPGAELAPGYTLAGTEHHRVLLRDAHDQLIPLRLAPRLEGTLGLDVLVERRPRGDLEALTQAVRRVKAALRRNGADELGIVERAARPTPAHPAAMK